MLDLLALRHLATRFALLGVLFMSGCTATSEGAAERDTFGPIGALPDPAGSGACQHVAWSPDSRLLACYGFYGFDGDRPTVRRTLIVAADDGRVLHTLEDVMWASFSPDGRRIVFTQTLDGQRELFTSALDGSDRRRLTENAADDLLGVWSPAGDRMAFCSTRNGERNIYTMAPDGSDVRQITNVDAADYNPEWSFDGTRLTFYREIGDGLDQIYTVRPDGTDLVHVSQSELHSIYPAFTRDGRLLFKRSPKGVDEGELVVFDPSTGESIVLTTRAHIARQSPHGRQIAYVASGHRRNAIFVSNSDGSGLRKLVE
jgi:Tol biopolymer transport system component